MTEIDTTIFSCFNKHCTNKVTAPGRCTICAETWATTCRVSQEAYERQKKDDQQRADDAFIVSSLLL